ncbi:hypothetical protein FS749_007365 [Ceratobasidium sp. UAMH 11750]|nr:hypothetical protein FS749_007365 [Ceratobasidium sp. UAMH 11750]
MNGPNQAPDDDGWIYGLDQVTATPIPATHGGYAVPTQPTYYAAGPSHQPIASFRPDIQPTLARPSLYPLPTLAGSTSFTPIAPAQAADVQATLVAQSQDDGWDSVRPRVGVYTP